MYFEHEKQVDMISAVFYSQHYAIPILRVVFIHRTVITPANLLTTDPLEPSIPYNSKMIKLWAEGHSLEHLLIFDGVRHPRILP